MKQLYFVRHGESEANAKGVWSPIDAALTDNGRWQATAAGCDARERGLDFDHIISSPLPRAHETARLIADELDYNLHNIELMPALVERNWGKLTGMPHKQFFDAGKTHRDIDDIEAAEPLEALQMRASNVLNHLYERPEERILIVGHGTFGRALRRAISGHSHEAEYDQPIADQRIPNAQIIRLI